MLGDGLGTTGTATAERRAPTTGTILAVYGSEQEDGGFLVEELCFAGLPQPLPWAGPSSDR